MGNEKKIIDRILTDAEEEARRITVTAKSDEEAILNVAIMKAEKEKAAYMEHAKAEAEKARAKEISGAEMSAKKLILSQKQNILEEVISEAMKSLSDLGDSDYLAVIDEMLDRAEMSTGCEIIVSMADKARLKGFIESKGLKVSDETREIAGGFIVKKGDIEYNYSFESILAVEHEQIEQIAAEILFS